ncbi:2-phospho-L-lactate guanylyltransferase [Methanopyrus sp. SNP6]|uniref:2-phospho-L-lactate guanylyltransferase n=1 Tax=Methanopyrus sp. SNP6 TaxID=1937005 RepID=UPI0011E5F1F2|nr:2-phospho-L-lactate guanylyltransferase [Methanopyrus sp. SNP6]
MRFVVPFADRRDRKTRLSSCMDEEMREKFALAMLRHVVDVLSKFGEVEVVTPDTRLSVPGAKVRLSNASLDELPLPDGEFGLVMSDLPLLSEEDVERALEGLEDADVVLCPSRRGGTSGVFVGEGVRFRPTFGGVSFPRNLKRAEERGMEVTVVKSLGFFADVDEPEDLLDAALLGKEEVARIARSVINV